MILYHGTPYYKYEIIKSDGILKVTDAVTAVYELDRSSGTVPGFVYLTDSPIAALQFGIQAWVKEIPKHHEETLQIAVYKIDIPNDLNEDPDYREFDKSLLTGLNAKAYVYDRDIFINESCKGIAYFMFGTIEKTYMISTVRVSWTAR